MSDNRPRWDFEGPVLALYPSKRLLDRLDEMQSVSELLVLPWLAKDVADWIRAWNPPEFGEASPGAGQPTIADPVVAAAMNSLTVMINMGTGIVHPSDKRTAIEIFRALYLNGKIYDPGEIRAWLVGAKGMDPGDADDIRDLAQKILDRRTIQGAGAAKKNTALYKRWVKESQGL